MKEFYRAEKVTNAITAIWSRSGEIMYFVEGENRAVLIDTCLGVRGLRALVETLTDKPVMVLLTHGHMDHAMGAPEFQDVYMNPADRDVYLAHSNLEVRKGYIIANIGGMEPWIDDDNRFISGESDYFKDLKENMIFDLGGLTVEVYSLPGHTKGTMVMLIPEERLLITGDACNNSVFLFDEFSLSVEEYRSNLLRVDRLLEGRYNRTFMMHHVMQASKDLLKNVISVCDDIMTGRADDIEFTFMGGTYYVAKKANERFEREDNKEGNIVYNRQKIFKERQAGA
ncbi:MAG: MBL fold metallo-hydrolase [Lachnospiraceae bacterium]|nr:MBL fold metallo-hydrolase [Lachnospiraceae bacterium]